MAAKPSSSDDFDATAYPYQWLMWHIAKKSFQTGAVLGIALWPIRARLRKQPLFSDPFALIGTSAAGASAVVFALASAKVATIKERVAVEDRAYRLHFNAAQNRVDLLSGIGALTGLTVSIPFAALRRPAAALGMAAIGSSIGVAAHVAAGFSQSTKH